MLLPPPLRKLVLAAHLTASVGWLGAVSAFLVLAVLGVTGGDEQRVRAAYLGMDVLVTALIVPLAFASLLSGLVAALGTAWGLFRHYWVAVKLALTAVAVAVLLLQVAPIHDMAVAAADPATPVGLIEGAARPLVHGAGGLAVLLVIQFLGVYKPRGLTRHGWRKTHESGTDAANRGDRALPP
ncbi:MAG: hypothetical protein FJZ01_24115 [Candidatus Sericytochromatia bacterium]|nr:hypothetical protein [Candidatus Tanganyikabacteria bacterium]